MRAVREQANTQELEMVKGCRYAALLAALVLGACGGGGGSGDSTAGSGTSSSLASSSAGTSSSAQSSSVASSAASSSAASSTSSAASSATSSAASSAQTSLAASAFNVDGYAAAASVTGGGVISETASTYAKVTNALEFLTALSKVKSGAVKVIEIAADLNLGYTEVTSAYPTATTVYSSFEANATPLLHPTLLTTGVSKITIQNFAGLTIYSKNGATLKHTELNIKNGSNLIIRNLKFDELWEWDESTKGDYDKNDWDYITIGDTSSATGGIWIDHCTFYKSYDGIVDIKKGASIVGATNAATQAANGITISWSEILPGDGSNGAFTQAMFDKLEASPSSYPMYNFLRNSLSQAEIMQVAKTVKKGHLIGATGYDTATSSYKETTGYTVTLHHNYYKDLQDRMPRLRRGDVQVFNLYADASNARSIKTWYDAKGISTSTYKFGITSNGSISTEQGMIEVTNSVYKGVLTPLRNNQECSDNTCSPFTGAIVATGTRMELLSSTDSSYLANPQGSYTDSLGTWMYWQGNSTDSGSPLAATQATAITFAWHNGTPPTPKRLDATADVAALVTGNAGAGKLSLTAAQWMNANN